MVSTSLLITTDYLPGSVDGSLISRSWFVVLSPAASLLCAISSLHHHSGHEIPEFGSLFAIDCSELPLPAKANDASNIMRHGVETELHGRLLSSVIKCICLVMVALDCSNRRNPQLSHPNLWLEVVVHLKKLTFRS